MSTYDEIIGLGAEITAKIRELEQQRQAAVDQAAKHQTLAVEQIEKREAAEAKTGKGDEWWANHVRKEREGRKELEAVIVELKGTIETLYEEAAELRCRLDDAEREGGLRRAYDGPDDGSPGSPSYNRRKAMEWAKEAGGKFVEHPVEHPSVTENRRLRAASDARRGKLEVELDPPEEPRI